MTIQGMASDDLCIYRLLMIIRSVLAPSRVAGLWVGVVQGTSLLQPFLAPGEREILLISVDSVSKPFQRNIERLTNLFERLDA